MVLLNLSDSCQGGERTITREINFTLIIFSCGEMGVIKFIIFLVSLPYRCSMPNLVKIGPVVFKKILMHDA